MITKLRTETVHLFNRHKEYLGAYAVLNDNKRIVSILVDTAGYTEVFEFGRATGKLIRPKHWLGVYYIVNYLPLTKRS